MPNVPPVRRAARWLACLLAALLVALPALAGEVLVDVLDVGQGDSILIRGGGKTVLIDAGVPESRVPAQLAALGVGRIDLLVSTHPHADHIGDMEEVVRALDVGLYMDNGLPHTTATYAGLMAAIEERGIPYRAARAGTKIKLGDEATITVLFPTDTPLTETRSDLNSNSVVLLLEHGENSFLFPGDAEEPTEQALLQAGLGQVDVLKAAHHGSGHSSTEPFMSTTHPSIVLISCGTGNRYGHPYEEALARYAAVGAKVYRTDLLGHIRVASDGKTVRVQEGLLAEFRGAAARSGPGGSQASGGRSGRSGRSKPVEDAVGFLDMSTPIPAGATAEEMGVDLSGAVAPNPLFEDIGPDTGRRGKKKNPPREATP